MSTRKKSKRTPYSKIELDKARDERNVKIIGELAGKLMQGNIPLSMAETDFAASVLRATREEGSICFIDLATIPGAQNFIFKKLYLEYHADLEGRYGIDKATGLASIEEKKADVIRLNEYCIKWKEIISKNNHSDTLLNLIINEANREIKSLEQQLSSGLISEHDFIYKEKSVVLHSKYLYLTARAFFEEHGSTEVVAKFHDSVIIVDQFSLVHILYRHYAEGAKQYDTKKSFHSDILKWYELPYELQRVIETLGSHESTRNLPLRYIPFKYKGVIYAIWTERKLKHVGKISTEFTRLQTCYPLVLSEKIQELNDSYTETEINSDLSVFIKRP